MDMSKKTYNSSERRKRREKNSLVFSKDYHNLKHKEEKIKKRCLACSECPMGVIGCDDERKPHGHGCGQECPECGVPYYHIHPHSNICSKGTPITDDVEHVESHMKHQLRWGKWLKPSIVSKTGN